MAFMSFTLCSADRAAAAVVSAVAYMYSAMCNKNKYDNGHGKLSLHRLHTRAHNVMLTLSSRQAKGLRLRGKYFSVLMAVSAVNGTWVKKWFCFFSLLRRFYYCYSRCQFEQPGTVSEQQHGVFNYDDVHKMHAISHGFLQGTVSISLLRWSDVDRMWVKGTQPQFTMRNNIATAFFCSVFWRISTRVVQNEIHAHAVQGQILSVLYKIEIIWMKT